MKTIIFIAFFFISIASSAQYLKLDNSVISSAFSNENALSYLYSDRITTYAPSLGVDYFMKKHFYLSSQLGYMQLGGRDISTTEEHGQIVTNNVTESGHYFQLNTVGRVYIQPDSRTNFFIGIGPYINLLASRDTFTSPFFQGLKYEDFYWGGRAEAGITFEINKLKIGLVGAYLHSLSSPVKSEFLSLQNNALSFAITTGYRIW